MPPPVHQYEGDPAMNTTDIKSMVRRALWQHRRRRLVMLRARHLLLRARARRRPRRQGAANGLFRRRTGRCAGRRQSRPRLRQSPGHRRDAAGRDGDRSRQRRRLRLLSRGAPGGPEGSVIGVDMTHEMLPRRATTRPIRRRPMSSSGWANWSICRSPTTPSTSILSNCVINLVPDKAQVFREAFRVLKPGGRLAISDVVNTRAAVRPTLQSDPALLCGCVSGAAPVARDRGLAHGGRLPRHTGHRKPESRALIATWAPGRGIEDHVVSASIEATKP